MIDIILMATTSIFFVLFAITRFKLQILERDIKKADSYVKFTQDNIEWYKGKLLEIAEETENFGLFKEVTEYSETRRKQMMEVLDND